MILKLKKVDNIVSKFLGNGEGKTNEVKKEVKIEE